MIRRVYFEGKEIILVGTAHISKDSIILVEKTILEEQPDVIGVELDKDRFHQLISNKKWEEMDIVSIVKEGKTYLFLLNILLSNMQKQLGQIVGVKPGAEMLVAIKKSEEIKKPIALLDRDIKITLKRAFSLMTLREKIKLGTGIIGGLFGAGETITPEKIEELKKDDLINKLMKELGNQMPSIKKVLVDERDEFLAEKIRQINAKKIVAIVGAGHLNGIVDIIENNKKVDIKKISEIPTKKSYFKYLKWIIPALFLITFIILFYFKGLETTLEALLIWFLINGVFSAVGAIIARAHPISIVVAFLAAPFTSVHPAFAAGWFAAASETKFNPPLVKDFENLSSVSTVSGFYSNKVTHLLLVAAIVNIGSTIGTIIAFPIIFNLLF